MRFSELTTFTLQELDALLDGRELNSAYQEVVKPTEVQTSNQGPGYLNKWSLLEGNENAWQKLAPSHSKPSRRKIILCNPIQAGYGPTEQDVIFIAALVEHCDVYLWPKNSISMSEVSCITSTSHYWENRSSIKIASKPKVQKALAEQGINTHEYLILDLIEYQKIMVKLRDDLIDSTDDYKKVGPKIQVEINKEISTGCYLDFNDLQENLTDVQFNEVIHDGINYDELRFVMTDSIGDVGNLNPDYLPNIDLLIKNPDMSAINRLLELPFHGLLISGHSGEERDFVIEKEYGLKKIVISDCNFNLIDLTRGKNLDVIHIDTLAATFKKIIFPNKIKIDEIKFFVLDEFEVVAPWLREIGTYLCYRVNNVGVSFEKLRSVNKLSLLLVKELKKGKKKLDLNRLVINEVELEEVSSEVILPSGCLEKIHLSDVEEVKIGGDQGKLKEVYVNGYRFEPNASDDEMFLPATTFLSAVTKFSPNLVKLTARDLSFNELDLSNNKSLMHLELNDFVCHVGIKASPETVLEKFIMKNCDSYPGDCQVRIRAKTVVTDDMWGQKDWVNLDKDILEELRITGTLDSDYFDLSPFKNLKNIKFSHLINERINLKDNFLLETIEVNKINGNQECDLVELDLSSCVNLRDISVSANNLKKIIFAQQAKPKSLSLNTPGDCSFVDLDASELIRASFHVVNINSILSLKSASLRQLRISGRVTEDDCDSDVEGDYDLNQIAPNLISLHVPYRTAYFNFDECKKIRFYEQSGYAPNPNSTNNADDEASRSQNQADDSFDNSEYDNVISSFNPPVHAELFIAEYSYDLAKKERNITVEVDLSARCHNLILFKVKNYGRDSDIVEVMLDSAVNLLTFESEKSSNVVISDESRARLSAPGRRVMQDDSDEQSERTISCYNNSSSLEIDADTGVDANPRRASGNIFTKVISANKVDVSQFRIITKDGYYIDDNNKLRLRDFDYDKSDKELCNSQISAIDSIELPSFERNIAKYPSHNLSHLWGKINANEWYVLPLTAPCSDPKNARFYVDSVAGGTVDVYWVPTVRQFIFKYTSKNSNELEIDLYCFAEVNARFRDKNRLDEVDIVVVNERLLPDKLYWSIYRLVLQHKELSILIDKDKSINEKHDFIVDYCSGFTIEKLNSSHPKGSIGDLLSIISEMKGVCRHRSFAYLALTHFIGIYSWINANEKHAIGEVLCLDENGSYNLLGIDLGGGDLVDLTNEADFREPKLVNEGSVEFKFNEENLRHRISMLESSAIESQKKVYKNLFDFYVKKNETTSISELFKPSDLPFVIAADDKSFIFKINELIFREVSNNHQNYSYLYIHNLRELVQFYNSAYYSATGLKNNKSNSVLMNFIKKKSIILINWSAFTAQEIANYKSCFDGKLFGHSTDPSVLFLGIITPDTPACSAFYSRCKLVYLSPDLFFTQVLAGDAKSSDNLNTVDFFERPFWQEAFYGEVKFKGKNVELIESLPIRTVRSGSALTICRPPKSDELDLQLHRLNVMGSIFYNGQFINAAAGFSVTTSAYSSYDKAQNIAITPDKLPDKRKEKIVVGTHNFYKLYSQLSISGSEGEDTDGLLHAYDPEKNVFYLLDSIPKSEWQYLVDFVNKKFPNKKFELCLSAGASIDGIFGQCEIEMGTVCLSNDPYYHALSASNLEPNRPPILVPVSPLSTFEQLIYSIKIPSGDGIGFVVNTCSVIKSLLEGKAIILYGTISQQLFNELFTLLEDEPYYIDSKNERIEVKGKLHLILSDKNNLKLGRVREVNYTIDDYSWAKEDLICVDKIKLFYKLTNEALAIYNSSSIDMPRSYYQLRAMVDRLKSPLLHPNNPIKGKILYNYNIDGDIYALMNIIAKYVFVPDRTVAINQVKLSRLIHKLKNKENGEIDVDQYYFRILNCFSGKALRYIVGDDIAAIFRRNNEEVNARFLAAIEKFNDASLVNDPGLLSKDYAEQLKLLLNDSNTPLILPTGAPGTGKTYNARKLPKIDSKIKLFEGESSIEKWLTSRGDEDDKLVLLLDEANMALPGTWDFLKGIFHKDKIVLYKGEFYQLSNNHRIIAAVNPDDYPGRYEHEFFKEFGEVLYFKKPSMKFLKQRISQLVRSNSYHSYLELDMLYKVFQLYMQYQPYMAISIRDLESLVSRYCALVKLKMELNNALYEACLYEYPYSIADSNMRNQFIEDIKDLFQDAMTEVDANDKEVELHEYLPGYYLTTPKQTLAKIIEQDIRIRQLNIDPTDQNNTNLVKRGVLLEGDSGVGKSTLYLKILQKMSYAEDHKDLTKRYYYFSALDLEIEQRLEQAFHEGAIVVLDELDLAPKLEACLNHFLTGVDKNGLQAKRPGFMLLASQNGTQFVGREATPLALANRLHYIHVDPFTDAELIVIAKRVVSDAEAFVLAYREAQREYPNRVNMRTFRTVLNLCERKNDKLHERDDEADKADKEHSSKRQRKLDSKDSPGAAVSSSANAKHKRPILDEKDSQAGHERLFKRQRKLDKNDAPSAAASNSSDDHDAMDIDTPSSSNKNKY